ncbi:hypothetical protein [Ideonella paludis]|uniref:hypothetical protein n=1 Tax=Ideonella paludis TaxID=1233411 RepID=UPI0036298B09
MPADAAASGASAAPDAWALWADPALRSLQAQAVARNRDVSQALLRVQKPSSRGKPASKTKSPGPA